jgi:hypothetical protein
VSRREPAALLIHRSKFTVLTSRKVPASGGV